MMSEISPPLEIGAKSMADAIHSIGMVLVDYLQGVKLHDRRVNVAICREPGPIKGSGVWLILDVDISSVELRAIDRLLKLCDPHTPVPRDILSGHTYVFSTSYYMKDIYRHVCADLSSDKTKSTCVHQEMIRLFLGSKKHLKSRHLKLLFELTGARAFHQTSLRGVTLRWLQKQATLNAPIFVLQRKAESDSLDQTRMKSIRHSIGSSADISIDSISVETLVHGHICRPRSVINTGAYQGFFDECECSLRWESVYIPKVKEEKIVEVK